MRGYGITECVIISCLDEPCVNGGTCVPEVGNFSCYCPLGFGGNTCADGTVNIH